MGEIHTLTRRDGRCTDRILDAATEVIAAAHDAGVSFYLDEDDAGAVRLRACASGGIPDELRAGIEGCKQEIIVRLLASISCPHIGVPAPLRGKTAGEVWGRQSLEDHARFGVAAARLYSFIDDDVTATDGDGRRRTATDGDGELFNVIGGTATVMLQADHMRATATAASTGKRGSKKPVLATREYPAENVYPAIPAAARPGYVPLPAIDEVPAEIEGTASPAIVTERAPQSTVADLAARRTRDKDAS